MLPSHALAFPTLPQQQQDSDQGGGRPSLRGSSLVPLDVLGLADLVSRRLIAIEQAWAEDRTSRRHTEALLNESERTILRLQRRNELLQRENDELRQRLARTGPGREVPALEAHR